MSVLHGPHFTKGQVCGKWLVDPHTCCVPLRADAVIEIPFKFQQISEYL